MTHLQFVPHKKGFTLIETLIYIALFGILLAGIVSSSYPLITGADKLSQHALSESETAFVLQKIDWALSSVSDASLSGSELRVTRVDGGTVWFRQGSGVIEISTDSGSNWFPITATRVVFSSFTASIVVGTPRAITVNFNVNNEVRSQTYNAFY